MDSADIMFHVPADLSIKDCGNIERDIQGCDGVDSEHFRKTDTHMLEVAYNPQVIDSETLRRHVSERGPGGEQVRFAVMSSARFARGF